MKDLLALPFFSGLTDSELSLLQEKAVKKTFSRGSTVFMEGQETDGFYILVSGQAKVFMLHRDGREKTLAILGQGDILGEVTLFGSCLRSAYVEAMEDTLFFIIPRREIEDLLQKIPALSIKIIEILSDRLRSANRQIQELAFYNARNRVVLNLLELSEKYGKEYKGTIRLNIRLTHAELAKLAGVSRETVTKVLGSLQDDKLISLTQRHVGIVDKKGLLDLLH